MDAPLNTSGIHHIGLRCSDLDRARKFYGDLLGFKVIREKPVLIFLAGATAIAMKGPEKQSPPDDAFNPFRIGLDHIALACDSEAELRRIADALSRSGVENSGIKPDDQMNGRLYVAFKDPDRIAWEFYMTK